MSSYMSTIYTIPEELACEVISSTPYHPSLMVSTGSGGCASNSSPSRAAVPLLTSISKSVSRTEGHALLASPLSVPTTVQSAPTQPSIKSGSTGGSALSYSNYHPSLVLNVRFVSRDRWKRITFPPGITVTQARDICLLRFGLWQQTSPPPSATRDSSDSGTSPTTAGALVGPRLHSSMEQIRWKGLTARAGSTKRRVWESPTTPGGEPTSPTTATTAVSREDMADLHFREKFGLFWTASGHWLEPSRLLSSYPLEGDDIIELQVIKDFVPFLPETKGDHYVDGYLYWFHTKGISSAWRVRWVVLKHNHLWVFKRRSDRVPETTINLSKPFNLIGQGGSSIDSLIGGKQNPDTRQQGYIFMVYSELQSYVFRTVDKDDYDLWQRVLKAVQGSHLSGPTNSYGGSYANGSLVSRMGTIQSHGSSNSSSSSSGGAGSATTENLIRHSGDRPAHRRRSKSEVIHPLSLVSSLAAIEPRFEAGDGTPVYRGYMTQKLLDGYGFRRRFFVLEPTKITVYAKEEMEGGEKDSKSAEQVIALDSSSMWVEICRLGGRSLLTVIQDRPATTVTYSRTLDGRRDNSSIGSISNTHYSDNGQPQIPVEILRCIFERDHEAVRWKQALSVVAGLPIQDNTLGAGGSSIGAHLTPMASRKGGSVTLAFASSPPSQPTSAIDTSCGQAPEHSTSMSTSFGGHRGHCPPPPPPLPLPPPPPYVPVLPPKNGDDGNNKSDDSNDIKAREETTKQPVFSSLDRSSVTSRCSSSGSSGPLAHEPSPDPENTAILAKHAVPAIQERRYQQGSGTSKPDDKLPQLPAGIATSQVGRMPTMANSSQGSSILQPGRALMVARDVKIPDDSDDDCAEESGTSGLKALADFFNSSRITPPSGKLPKILDNGSDISKKWVPIDIEKYRSMESQKMTSMPMGMASHIASRSTAELETVTFAFNITDNGVARKVRHHPSQAFLAISEYPGTRSGGKVGTNQKTPKTPKLGWFKRRGSASK